MSRLDQLLNDLTDRARHGDAGAFFELRDYLEPTVRHRVRRAIRGADRMTPLSARVKEEVGLLRTSEPNLNEMDREWIVERVVGIIFDDMFARLRSGDRLAKVLRDTISISREGSVFELTHAG